jgi:ABC-2 type transport system ATP-binding protein
MTDTAAIVVDDLWRRYGSREALRGVSFEVRRGEIFGLLGPNGGGKTTLFRILSTSIAPSAGCARVMGFDVVAAAAAVRPLLGVVFQAPSLDKKLTVLENLTHHGHLYGWRGPQLRQRTEQMLATVGLADRSGDRVETLSGGLARRVEVAKGLLHRPAVLLLDEPSTGLDPGARRDLWNYLAAARERDGITMVVTTHLMEEAEHCDRVAILDRGQLVALGSPADLKSAVHGEVVMLEADRPQELAEAVAARWGVSARLVDGSVRVETEAAHKLVAELFEAFPGQIESVTVRRPSLEDVFVHRTGRQIHAPLDG